MRALLDTHALLWFLLDDARLSETATSFMVDPAHDLAVSPATYWEIAIKIRLGKYSLPQPYQLFMETQLAANDIGILPILPKHTAVLTTMPFHHRDPFDRLLIAQAQSESVPLVSNDGQLDAYGITRIW